VLYEEALACLLPRAPIDFPMTDLVVDDQVHLGRVIARRAGLCAWRFDVGHQGEVRCRRVQGTKGRQQLCSEGSEYAGIPLIVLVESSKSLSGHPVTGSIIWKWDSEKSAGFTISGATNQTVTRDKNNGTWLKAWLSPALPGKGVLTVVLKVG